MITARQWFRDKPIAKYRSLRNGREFWVMPTIVEGHYYTYEPNHTGLFAAGACTDYDKRGIDFGLEHGIIELIDGQFPD